MRKQPCKKILTIRNGLPSNAWEQGFSQGSGGGGVHLVHWKKVLAEKTVLAGRPHPSLSNGMDPTQGRCGSDGWVVVGGGGILAILAKRILARSAENF